MAFLIFIFANLIVCQYNLHTTFAKVLYLFCKHMSNCFCLSLADDI